MAAPEPVLTLTEACGHHCGVSVVGQVRQEGHCPCSECHDDITAPISITSRREHPNA